MGGKWYRGDLGLDWKYTLRLNLTTEISSMLNRHPPHYATTPTNGTSLTSNPNPALNISIQNPPTPDTTEALASSASGAIPDPTSSSMFPNCRRIRAASAAPPCDALKQISCRDPMVNRSAGDEVNTGSTFVSWHPPDSVLL